MKILTFILLILSSVGALAEVQEMQYEAKELKRIRVKNSNGSIKVLPSGKDTLHVVLNKKIADGCNIKDIITPLSYRLEIKEEKRGFFSPSKCQVEIELRVPKDVSLEVATASGNIELIQVGTNAIVRTASGNILIDSAVKDLNISTASGDVELKQPINNARVHTSSGDVKIAYPTMPKAGELNVSANSGNIEILTPTQARAKTQLKTYTGSLINEIGNDMQSNYSIKVNVGSGNIRVQNKL